MPLIVPVNVGLANIVALDSLVTLPRPMFSLTAGVLLVTTKPATRGVSSSKMVLIGLLTYDGD